MIATRDEERTMSIDEYARMPDDGYRTELVRGHVVREPQPGLRHGDIQLRLGALIVRHIEEHGLPLGCLGPAGFILERDPPTVRGPDLAVLPTSRYPAFGYHQVDQGIFRVQAIHRRCGDHVFRGGGGSGQP